MLHGGLSLTIRARIALSAYIQQMRDDNRTGLDLAVGPKAPGFTAIGIFLFFGAIMASLAATTLLWRGTPSEKGALMNRSSHPLRNWLLDRIGIAGTNTPLLIAALRSPLLNMNGESTAGR